jgi:hypothetical protein
VIDAVAGMDLSAFYAAYREDGHGRAAHDPAMMVALVLGPVDRVGLGQDLAGDLVVVEVLVLRGVRVHLRAIHRQHRHADQTGVRTQLQHLAEQGGQGGLVAPAKAGDRAMIGPLVRRHHADRHIIDTGPLDRPRRTPPHGVGVEQQRFGDRR